MTGLHWKPTDADGLRWELWIGERRFCGRVRVADVGRVEALWLNGFGAVQVERSTLRDAGAWLLGRTHGMSRGSGRRGAKAKA